MAKTEFPPLLHLAYILQQSADELLLRQAGISLSHARILSGISNSPVTQRQLATELQQTEANVSRQLKAMQKLGLVSVEKNKKDARARDVKLTNRGEIRYQKALEVLSEFDNGNGLDVQSALKTFSR